jgi:tetratricopeptide (TPR) repeat protein
LAQDCPACGHAVSPRARFCESCGQVIQEITAQRPVPEPRAYTPKHLAEKILTSRSALEGERKQVTVNQYTGDGIMALFGAPIAHEDHARRACYTALHLQGELRRYADELRLNRGLNFSVRMGLNSGEVVVGKIGDDLPMDYSGDAEAYLYHGTEAVRVADQTDDAGLKLACRSLQFVAYGYSGRFRQALQLRGQVLASHPEDPALGIDIFGFSPYILVDGSFGGAVLAWAGQYTEAAAGIGRAGKLARQVADAESLGWAHASHLELARITAQEPQAALSHARQEIEIAERIGSAFSRVTAHMDLGEANILAGEWNPAVGELEQGLQMARETRACLVFEAHVLVALAQAYLSLGDSGRAGGMVDEAVAVARRRSTKFFECEAQLTRARVLLRAEGAKASADIRAALGEAQRLVEETGGRSQEPLIHEELAELARLNGDESTHERELREAHRLFTEMGAAGHAERLAKEVGL